MLTASFISNNTARADSCAEPQFEPSAHANAAEIRCPQRVDSVDAVPKGLAPSDWSSIRAAYEAGRLAVQRQDDGTLAARNPGQQWRTQFDERGFTASPNAGGWSWGLELKSYGFTDQTCAIAGHPNVIVAGQRVAYDWDDTVQEWFVNDSRGLEHGFTVRARPAGVGDRLLVNLAVRGNLRPELQSGSGVSFVDASGAVALTYAGLVVQDAAGRNLPAGFEVVDGYLRLSIDEGGAQYRLTIDPLAQQAYLKASNTDAGDSFGFSVAVSGDTIVVGARNESSNATGVNGDQTNNNVFDAGAAYVFVRNGTTWSQ